MASAQAEPWCTDTWRWTPVEDRKAMMTQRTVLALCSRTGMGSRGWAVSADRAIGMTDREIVLPGDYQDLLKVLKERVRDTRAQALRTVNTQLIELYWSIGRDILLRQEAQGWGSGIVGRLADDLRAEFPEITGFSRRNLQYMRSMAEAWGGGLNVPQAVAHLPCGHIRVLLDKLNDREALDWYAGAAVEYGWSRNVLLNMIMGQAMQRRGPRRRILPRFCRGRALSWFSRQRRIRTTSSSWA